MAIEIKPGDIKAIGIVRNKVKKWIGVTNSKEVFSDIVLDKSLVDGLDGLEEFSHATILFWMPRSPGTLDLKFHPGHREELPLVGIFASRSPKRANPIAKTIVKIISRRDNVLKVQGLDAIDSTPVIDIIPYMPQSDSVDDAKVPSWVLEIYKSLRKSAFQPAANKNITRSG